ncbi:MAG: DUF2628 domain-containing protein [Erysipelotrichales bacterium]|nr:DUF2628 domain-containing protein [Erysipelotrichales bacterium]
MGYAYEEDKEKVVTNTEEVDESLHVIKKETKNETVSSETMENLFFDDEHSVVKESKNDNNSIDFLLQSDEEVNLNLDNLLNKNDAKLFSIYLGSNSDKITGDRFNYAAFFFCGSYFIYRKVYLVGIILEALALGALIFFPIALVKWYIILIFELILALCSGFLANQIILNDVGSKILNYKISKEKNIKEKLASDGGVNVIAFIIAFIIYSSVYVLCMIDLFDEIISTFTTF